MSQPGDAWHPPKMSSGCSCVTPICLSTKLRCECPGCRLAPFPAAAWDGKSHCLDAISRIKIHFGFSGARVERKERVAQQCPPHSTWGGALLSHSPDEKSQ